MTVTSMSLAIAVDYTIEIGESPPSIAVISSIVDVFMLSYVSKYAIIHHLA